MTATPGSSPTSPRGWRELAACAAHSADLFFPSDAGGGCYAEGKLICADCPVRVACLDYAKREHIEHGLWGGLTPAERSGRSIRVERKRTTPRCVVCGTRVIDSGHGPRPRTCSSGCSNRARFWRTLPKRRQSALEVNGMDAGKVAE